MAMSRTVLCNCLADPLASVAARSVLVREGARVIAFRGVPSPSGARELFQRIASVVRVGRLPLAWLESAGGRGGFFRGDLVAVGDADVRELTVTILARFPRSGGWAFAPEVRDAVVRVLLAHEVGHAVQAKLGLEASGPRAEQEADLTAGWIAESLGWSAWSDALVLEAVGSPLPGGSHPSPAARLGAYREGRRMRRARRAA
jgi:hypothetical protein